VNELVLRIKSSGLVISYWLLVF